MGWHSKYNTSINKDVYGNSHFYNFYLHGFVAELNLMTLELLRIMELVVIIITMSKSFVLLLYCIGAPRTEDSPHWQLHAHYYPPLLRSATVSYFLKYEFILCPVIELCPEVFSKTKKGQCFEFN